MTASEVSSYVRCGETDVPCEASTLGWFEKLFHLQDLLLTALIFVPLERLIPSAPQQKILRRNWLNDFIFLIVNGWFIGLGMTAIIGGTIFLRKFVIPEHLRLAVAGQPGWLQLIEMTVLADLGFYAVHRLFHTVPFLWRIHAVHHSIEQMDWLAASRVHPIDQTLTIGGALVPCFALGVSPWAIGAYVVLYHWHGVFLHANAHIDFGRFGWLISSPNFHHWHHSQEPEARDRNFAAQLPILDILFGTAYMPAGRWTPSYGISEAMQQNYVDQILHPFRRQVHLTQAVEEPPLKPV